MKLSHIVIMTVVAFALLFVGCDSTGAGGGGDNGSDTGIDHGTVTVMAEDDGTVTTSVSGASDVDGDHLWVWLYEGGEWNVDSAETVLAAGSHEIIGGAASFVLNESDGNWGYSSVNWRGGVGTTYDLYIMSAPDSGQPNENSGITAEYPVSVTIDDSSAVETTASMVNYRPTTGTLTVELTGAETRNGKDLVAGVFAEGEHPANDDPLAYGVQEIADGTASIEITPWAGTASTEYEVFIIIYMDDRGDSGPQPGEDYIYQTPEHGVPWYCDGDRTMRPELDDFVLIPAPDSP